MIQFEINQIDFTAYVLLDVLDCSVNNSFYRFMIFVL